VGGLNGRLNKVDGHWVLCTGGIYPHPAQAERCCLPRLGLAGCIEVNKKQSKPFLISTWYRPPGSDIDIFNDFELFLFKCDKEDKEIIMLGDLNCDFSKVPQGSVLESYKHCAPYIN
jgi:hypothetical protein